MTKHDDTIADKLVEVIKADFGKEIFDIQHKYLCYKIKDGINSIFFDYELFIVFRTLSKDFINGYFLCFEKRFEEEIDEFREKSKDVVAGMFQCVYIVTVELKGVKDLNKYRRISNC